MCFVHACDYSERGWFVWGARGVRVGVCTGVDESEIEEVQSVCVNARALAYVSSPIIQLRTHCPLESH